MPQTVSIARQELTDQQKLEATRDSVKLTKNRTEPQLRAICIALCMENMRLMLEANAARAAAGLEPLPSYEVS